MPAPGNTHGPLTIPSLDGFRAVAVLLVFVGHGFTAPRIWPGHVGVTIFFFLSGYLITTLLRREYAASGRISLQKFYLRRALRILPPAYITIIAAIVIGAIGLLPATTDIWGVLAEVFNYTNYYIVVVGHEGLPPETSQLWSLAVEEHFYLVFPAALILMLRKQLSITVIGRILLIAVAIAPLWRIALTVGGADFYRLYTSTDTRFDTLLAGAAMALLWNPALGDRFVVRVSERTLAAVLVPAGAVVFAATSLVGAEWFRLTIADTIQIICLVPIFWWLITKPQSWVGKIFNSRVVVRIGLLSFSIYLVHRLVLALTHTVIAFNPLNDFVALIVTIAIAQLIYWLVEKPLGRVRKRLETRLPTRSRASAQRS